MSMICGDNKNIIQGYFQTASVHFSATLNLSLVSSDGRCSLSGQRMHAWMRCCSKAAVL